ncbi:hypothetical protein [Phaeobacter sp. C3_T13_0]|uniref:hypothetical protein n=1 Tax=Phaeobacter cretensis TaxID=3342641 RepID=UPI0039BC84A2
MSILTSGKIALIHVETPTEGQQVNEYRSVQVRISACNFNAASAQRVCDSAHRIALLIWWRRLHRAALATAAGLALVACSSESDVSRASNGSEHQPGDITRMSFASDTIHVVPPAGFCIDPRMTGNRAEGGFAIVVPCSSLRPGSSNRNRALITVTVGPAGPADAALTNADLFQNARGARLLTERNDMMLPLVKLNMPDHRARGASPVHWRGAFVLNDQLVAVALYAPSGSRNLGRRGAQLLNELTAKTLEASVTADLDLSVDEITQ